MKPFDTNKFYLGKLCIRGHDYEGTGHSLRYKSRKCVECNKLQNKKWEIENKENREKYHREYREKEGYKEKLADYCHKRYLANKEKILKQSKDYYYKNKKRVLARHAQDYQNNKGVRSKRKREYNQENKEVLAEYKKKWYQENKEWVSIYGKEYYQKNKEAVRKRRKRWYLKNRKYELIKGRARRRRYRFEQIVAEIIQLQNRLKEDF